MRTFLLAAGVLAVAFSATGDGPRPASAGRTPATAIDEPIAASLAPATGIPRLLRFTAARPTPAGDDATERAIDILTRKRHAFGLADPVRELEPVEQRPDPLGGEQVVFRQVFRGIQVFGALMRVHFDADGAVSAINGSFVPGIDVDTVPNLLDLEAEAMALRLIAKAMGLDQDTLEVSRAELMVYREGLVRGVPGANHLAWEVEVVAPPDVHEVLYIDAHNGRLIDRRSEIHHLRRVIHVGRIPNAIWTEGDPLPFSSGSASRDQEINELIAATGDTFSLFANVTNGQYLSYDGDDAAMNSVYDADNITCPNAVESGGVTAFCVGMVTDDVVAHEWSHAYTGWTHSLIYQWQPGALNEAYSDIFGELVDQINGRGGDNPGDLRPTADCSSAGGRPIPSLVVVEPQSLAGGYDVGGAEFNPLAPWTVTARVELADDGTGVASDACEPLVGFSAGSIAVIDRGTCFFRDKVVHAQEAGAVGVIIVNNQGDGILEMGGDPPRLDTPAVFLGQSNGQLVKDALPFGVTVTLSLESDFNDSVRWLIGEDSTALGAIRDMWVPECFGDPGRVTSSSYHCSSSDSGGVHHNSGVPNHAFALLVDGGSFNGRNVRGIGHTKAARIYWRAMATYQTPVTDFHAHAELLETSCRDLIGAQLFDLETGAPSAHTIDSDDCAQVALATSAVEMEVFPSQCQFQPILDPDAPSVAGDVTLFDESFDSDPGSRWLRSNRGVYIEYEPRDWVWIGNPPDGGDGGAFFALDSVFIGDCLPGSDDQSGVMELTSPEILVPRAATDLVLTFDHWVATEAEWDGGNIKLSVDDGPFTQIPVTEFVFNPYNNRITVPNSNPLAGQWAFTGANQGSLSGSWGQSQIDLDRLVPPGSRIRLRFDFGVDGCNGAVGWYVDNVKIVGDMAVSVRSSGGRVRP
jgi:Zn-dependent metalloprotease